MATPEWFPAVLTLNRLIPVGFVILYFIFHRKVRLPLFVKYFMWYGLSGFILGCVFWLPVYYDIPGVSSLYIKWGVKSEWGHFWNILRDFVFLGLFYYHVNRNPYIRKVIWVSMWVCCGISIISAAWGQGITHYNSLNNYLAIILFTAIVPITYFHYMCTPRTASLYNDGMFYILSAQLYILLAEWATSLTYNPLEVKYPTIYAYIWTVYCGFHVLEELCYITGLILIYKNLKNAYRIPQIHLIKNIA